MSNKAIPLTLDGQPLSLTTSAVQAAMKSFDRVHRGKETDTGTKYAVFDAAGKPYPPKWVISLSTGIPRNHFSGGTRINRALSDLGFQVDRAPRVIQTNKWPRGTPPIPELLKRLFSQKWKKLTKPLIKETIPTYPGVYLIAYPPRQEDLEDKSIKSQEVYYVGMSNYAGVSKRVQQFYNGTQRGGCHSGGNRFFKTHGIYNPGIRPMFISWLSIPCDTRKKTRKHSDLMIMGAVADLELCVMARIKQSLGTEPKLNAK